jgi:hypothetical protein
MDVLHHRVDARDEHAVGADDGAVVAGPADDAVAAGSQDLLERRDQREL